MRLVNERRRFHRHPWRHSQTGNELRLILACGLKKVKAIRGQWVTGDTGSYLASP
jgi:hypothetical protein